VFVHPADIPFEFAVAVLNIAGANNDQTDWSIVSETYSTDSMLGGGVATLLHIERIFEANDAVFDHDERCWWAEQLNIVIAEA